MGQPILQVKNLAVEFVTDDGIVRAVNDISFDLYPGETLGIVGESGSGKSVTNLTVLGLIPQPPGRVVSGEALFAEQVGEDLNLGIIVAVLPVPYTNFPPSSLIIFFNSVLN